MIHKKDQEERQLSYAVYEYYEQTIFFQGPGMRNEHKNNSQPCNATGIQIWRVIDMEVI